MSEDTDARRESREISYYATLQVIPHQVITGEQGKKYCETLPAFFERHYSEFSGGMPIKKTNIESLNLPCHNGLRIIKA